jgi:putative two-component system response regulator
MKMIELIKKITPDLILLDIKMPEMDGFETLAYLKSNSSYSDIPVIFLTGGTDAAIEAKGFELGVIDFITKPFSPPVLLDRIKTHLDIDEPANKRTTEISRQ